MSWWIYLRDDEDTVEIPRHSDGGMTDAELNVTYNYVNLFDFSALNGCKASDVVPTLRAAVEKLGVNRDKDYWKPTPGNVGYTCSILLDWANRHPDATFEVR